MSKELSKAPSAKSIDSKYVDETITFESFNLDPRLSQALANLGYVHPTLIQANAIPLAIQEKKDIIAKAKTGSGKTIAYLVPIIQALLENSSSDDEEKSTKALILVPTRELSEQVTETIESLLQSCGRKLKAVNIARNISESVQNSLLAEFPDIVVATPSRALNGINSTYLDPDEIQYLVIDEVDLVLSYGYEEDLRGLSEKLPLKKTVQTWLMSATINDDITALKTQFCRSPAVLKLQEEDSDSNNLVQYYTKCSELDKFLLAYVIFKLSLVKGKTIIFVNDIDRGYKLKLFFEQFGIRSCVLNSELPINSRIHIVEEFNKHVYNLLIATDESDDFSTNEKEEDEDEEMADAKSEEKEEGKPAEEAENTTKTKKNKKSKTEYGVSRGVDFKNVACVLNFDLPTSSRAYVHRIGRTARAGRSGMSLSFVVPKDQWGKHKQSSLSTARKDEKVLSRIIRTQEKLGNELLPYVFDMKQVEGFRYRMEDAFRAVTKVAVREARIKEIKNEIMTSEKLKRHFEENPTDLANLRHDKEIHPTRVQSHLKRVPEYLLPAGATTTKKIGFVPFHKNSKHRVRKHGNRKGRSSKKADPLKSFKG